METYGKILLMAMPAFLVLVLFEKWYGWRRGNDTVLTMDMISSLTSGVTNVTKDVLGLSIAIISYQWLVSKVALVHIQSTVWLYMIAFIALDFMGYWAHRLNHVYNIFWNNHLIHHSSEEFNLACALRQSISEIVKLFIIFLLPAALLGIPAQVIAIVAPIQLFAQFWYHTRHIGKMGWLEKVIVTPSHHRVHHAINKEYLDKNFAQIFIVWDKWFGTFQEELPDLPPVYGITRPVRTWNPIKINFQHIWLLIQDAWRAQHWKDKWRIWFMPTGWRPQDVTAKYPVFKIEDPYHFEKYNPPSSVWLRAWSWVQLIVILLFISYFFASIASINQQDTAGIYLYGLFIFLSVYALTELMDRNPMAVIWELLKNSFGVYLFVSQQDWFGMGKHWPFASYIILAYFVLSTLVTAWLVVKNKQEDRLRVQLAA
jgi:alkylglycerol monooxygenase